MPEIGTVYCFGHHGTPHRVTRVVPMFQNNQFVAIVYLLGPRGGESRAYVRKDGSCRKV